MALQINGMIGGSGGYYFTYYGGTDGRVMQRIMVWAATSRIKAIRVWLSDGVQRTFGDPSRPAGEGELRTAEFVFNTGERVTRLSLWGNGIGTRSGWIYFETSHGRRFNFGMYSWGQQTEFPQNVASGIWVGITGRSSLDMDALGVVFLRPIQSCQLISVQYPTLQFSGNSGGATSITPTTSSTKSFNLRNTADHDDKSSTEQLDWEVADEPAANVVSHSWSLSNSNAGLLQFITTSTISVSARTPALAVVNNAVGWQLSNSDTQGSSLSSTSNVPVSWSQAGSLLPSQHLALSAHTFRGDVRSLVFNGSAQVTTTNGGRFSYAGLQGHFNGQSHLPLITAEFS